MHSLKRVRQLTELFEKSRKMHLGIKSSQKLQHRFSSIQMRIKRQRFFQLLKQQKNSRFHLDSRFRSFVFRIFNYLHFVDSVLCKTFFRQMFKKITVKTFVFFHLLFFDRVRIEGFNNQSFGFKRCRKSFCCFKN